MAHLLKDIAEVRKYVTVNNSTKFELLEPHIRLATLRYLKPILGQSALDTITTAYNANTLTSYQQQLLPYLQQPLAMYMMALALPTMLVAFSNMGAHETQSQGSTATPVRQWTYFELQGSTLNAADLATEELLIFLDQTASSFPQYQSSSEFMSSRELFLNSATELAQFVDSRGSHRVYQALRPIMKNFTERQHVLPWICTGQWNELKTKIYLNLFTAEDLRLLQRIRAVVAYHSLVRLSNIVGIWITADGLRMPSTGNHAGGSTTNSADMELRMAFRREMESMAAAATNDLITFIKANLDEYPQIENSDCSPLKRSKQPWEMPDQSDQSSFMV